MKIIIGTFNDIIRLLVSVLVGFGVIYFLSSLTPEGLGAYAYIIPILVAGVGSMVISYKILGNISKVKH